MKKQWIYLINTFWVVTMLSTKKMLSLGADHLAKLEASKADPVIGMMYTRTKPLYETFESKYAMSKATKGSHTGETQRFTDKLKLLPDKLQGWDLKIQPILPAKSPDYKLLFYDARNPFYRGTYEQRINAGFTLATNLGKYPELAQVKDEVFTFFTDLQNARMTQQKEEGGVDTLSDELKTAHRALAQGMYANLGLLMDKHADNPGNIEAYFDLSLLRQHHSKDEGEVMEDTIELTIAAHQVMDAGIKLSANETLYMNNTGTVALGFYTASDATVAPPATLHTLAPDIDAEFPVAELGDVSNTCLMLVNNTDTAGSLEIGIV